MNARALTLLICLFWLGAANAAAPDPSVIERAVETTTKATLIPTALGAIAARGCTTCKERHVSLTSASKFYLGRTPISFADFQTIAGEPQGRFMTVFYRAVDDTVTRVVISAD